MSDEKLARQWAERKRKQVQRHLEDAGYFPREDTMAAIEHILATTTPPTMADVEWDHDKYHLHGATTPKGDEVVMLWHDDIDTDHIITDQESWSRDCLTPNGKRYELREVGEPEQPEHPATLVTLEDYENAPEGTIVASKDYFPYAKLRRGYWEHPRYIPRTDASMADTPRKVIRWGCGE